MGRVLRAANQSEKEAGGLVVPRLTFIRPPVPSSAQGRRLAARAQMGRLPVSDHQARQRCEAPNVVRGSKVEGRSLPPSRSLPKEFEGTRYPNSWSDNSEPTLAAPLLKAAHRVARSSACSRGQDQGWANPDDETRRSGGSFDGLGPLCFLCPPVRRRTITLEPGVASAVSNSLHSVHGRLPLC